MVKKDSEYDHLQALPLSTREDPSEGLLNGGSRHVGTFDVEFDLEDDVLLDWQKHGSFDRSCICCAGVVKLLPERLQQPPDWWWRFSKSQRNLLTAAASIGGCLLLLLSVAALVLLIISIGSHDRSSNSSDQQPVAYEPRFISPNASAYCSWTDLYLPRIVRPTNYKLHIKTDMTPPYLVEGEVEITLQVSEATPCIVLHSHGIDIKAVSLMVLSVWEPLPVAEYNGTIRSNSSRHQQVVLEFPAAVPTPPFTPLLRLSFSYPLREGLDGFYRSSFIDAANDTKVLASTQFESIAARKAFPCFDEPAFKASFEIKLTAPPAPIAVLSNMPLSHTHGGHTEDSSSSSSSLITYHFERTPAMSTYLVAWVVGELSHIEKRCQLDGSLDAPYADMHSEDHDHESHEHEEDHDEDDDGEVDDGSRGRSVMVRVWGTSDRASQFGHARDVACHALQTFEKLLQVAYPLPKLDLVAIPNFAAGAMENWGLLTYRETALLVDDSIDDIKQRYDIATTVAHETAHQWFGDLVTLDDWTELWLNEGFASYFEVVAADAYKPSWGYFNDFMAVTTSPALEADGVSTSHPLTISRPTEKLSEIDNWFDGVSYDKGAAVLRMLRAWLNRANGPMLGFSSSSDIVINTVSDSSDSDDSESGSSSSSGSGAGGDGSAGVGDVTLDQHARRRQRRQHRRRLAQAMEQYVGNAGDWWTQRVHVGSSVNGKLPSVQGMDSQQQQQQQQQPGGLQLEQAVVGQPVLPVLVPVPVDIDAAVPAGSSDTSSSTSNNGSGSSSGSTDAGSGSSVNWWTKKSHYGAATADLQQQAKRTVTESAAAASSKSRGVPAAAAPSRNVPLIEPDAEQQPEAEKPLDLETLGLKEDPFLLGLRSYLEDLSYGTTNYSLLWQHLEEATGQPIGDMMSTWTLRRGFPILSVSLSGSSSRNSSSSNSNSSSSSNQQVVVLEQQPYHAPRTYMVGLPFTPDMYCNDWTDDVQDSSWWMPVALRVVGSNAVKWHSFSNCSSNFTLAMPHNGWLLANAGRYGFYRVNYSEPLWSALAAAAVDKAVIGSADFAGLLDDAYSLSLVRQLNITVFLSLSKALGGRFQAEHSPWTVALGWLLRMTDVLASAAMLGNGGAKWQECLENLKSYVTAQLTGPLIANLKVPGQQEPGLNFKVNPHDSPELRLLRPKVLTAAGFLGHKQVVQQAVQLLQQVAAGQAVLSPDVTKAVYSLAVGSGDAGAYNTVKNMYEQALDAADKDRALKALARVSTAPLITKTLEYALSPAVRSQDFGTLLVSIAKQGGLGFNMTWEFVIDRAADIMAKYGGEDVTYTLGRPLNKLAKLFVDEDLLNRLKALEVKEPKLLSPTFIEEANEARIVNRDWLRFQGVDACAWLSQAATGGAAAGGGR